jgi:hypothetical protein
MKHTYTSLMQRDGTDGSFFGGDSKPQPKDNWIPVSERLPELRQEVLVFVPVDSWTKNGIEVDFLVKTPVGNYWDGSEDKPTHWQPLPAPPSK